MFHAERIPIIQLVRDDKRRLLGPTTMIRKTVLTVLTLLAIVCAVVWIGSNQRRIRYLSAEPVRPSAWRLRSFEAEWGRFSFEFHSLGPKVPRDEVGEDDLWKLVRNNPYPQPEDLTLRGKLASHGFSAGYWRTNKYFYEVLDDEGFPAIAAKRYEFRIHMRAWLLFILFAPYPTIAFIRGPFRRFCWRYSRTYRRERGLCERCAYDLTGNISGVCPECGTSIRVGEGASQ